MTTTPQSEAAPLPQQQRIGRLERSALLGVLVREMINYSSFWRSSAFSSMVEPAIYLMAFGLGVGSLVSRVNGFNYLDFVATGTVAMAVMFSAAYPSMFGTFVKYKFQRTYDAILAAPVDTEELVTAEGLWVALRTGVYGCSPLIVAFAFGLDPSWGMLLVPFICFISGLGWSFFGITVAATMNSIDNFSYVISGFMTPVMLSAGTFFPSSNLPDWLQVVSLFNPLYHSVELVRHAAFGWQVRADLGHVGFLLVFALVLWRVSISRMGRRLVD
jgi:lipooligosaccharide transport system permease protein